MLVPVLKVARQRRRPSGGGLKTPSLALTTRSYELNLEGVLKQV